MIRALVARCGTATARKVAIVAASAAFALACDSGGGHHGGPPYNVGGTIFVAAGSTADWDTNDPYGSYVHNDNAAQAQPIANPVTVGGHVNERGARPPGARPGRTTGPGDLEDWFRVSLAGGQTIRLEIAEDGTHNNLDLELRALDETLIASSETTGRTEEVVVPTSGEYYVVVVVFSGFSNYTLTIGQVASAVASAMQEPEFVPGQVLVRYRDDRSRSAAASGPARALAVGMRHVSGESSGPMLFAAETVAERRAAFAVLGLAPTPEMLGLGSRGERGMRDDTRQIAAALRRRSDVRSADLNYVRRATRVPTDVFFPLQWHYDQINLPQAWDLTVPDSGVVVAVIDTGVKIAHPDLAGQFATGFDFIFDIAAANDGDSCDANPDDPGDLALGGSSYHGTHVAGTVAARTSFSSGDSIGVAGVAWNARIMPLRVLGVNGGTDADIMEALRYAAGRPTTCAGPGATTPARIANMSLSGPGFSQTFQDLITDLRNTEGMIFVAAAGNEASLQPEYPAAFAGVISVSAIGPTRTLAPYSNFGPTIDVAAPGGDFERDVDGDGSPDGVLSTSFEDPDSFGYTYFQGTSMATPHVAGVLALMLGINPALTTFDIDNALNARLITQNIGSSQYYGNGLIDAARAANLAAQGGGGSTFVDPVLRVDPDTLNFGFVATEVQLVASNGGNEEEPLTVTGTSFTSADGAAWLTLTPVSVNASGLGTYRADVDRSALGNGIYTGTIHFTSDHNDVDVAVIMHVGNPGGAGSSAGHHYIQLVNPGTRKTLAALEADAVDGTYAFNFHTTAPGDYLVIAGTDADGDNLICDPGEGCGAFPTTETIVPITVDNHLTDLRFITGFEVQLGASAEGVAPQQLGYSREIGGVSPGH